MQHLKMTLKLVGKNYAKNTIIRAHWTTSNVIAYAIFELIGCHKTTTKSKQKG